eukprot:CAMPEP_0117630858 /NCGR_PEP_ID=MMETSP0802-20121206/3721_1 /TAXON_ID=38833 /ORGANISM="Micromonas sp., Strain CCMP2099" /LENGTH=401 /DNA_ID=CAMNT_0005435159 /DNA_START=1118 /DNA_END=2320 /DNA_ORIENTATION=-
MVKHVNQNHATRCFDTHALRERHPASSEAFEKNIVPTEIAVAFGGRRVRKLVDVLNLPVGVGEGSGETETRNGNSNPKTTLANPRRSETLPASERGRCMRYLLGLMTDQEAKALAIACDVSVALHLTLLREKETPENKTLACQLLQSVAHSREGRCSIIAIDAVVAAADLLKHDDQNVRLAAAGFLASLAKHRDGADATLRAAEGNVLVVLANAAVDTTTHANATAVKTLCCETLALLTVSDEGTEAALRAATTAAMKKTLQSESAQEMLGGVLLKAAATRCLKNICQHGVGKIKAFEMDVLAVILPLLRSKDTDLRLQATGALQCLTIENEAKIAVAKTSALFDLCALLRDTHKSVAENALAILQQCAEHPLARDLIRQCVSKRDIALVFDRRVVGESVV